MKVDGGKEDGQGAGVADFCERPSSEPAMEQRAEGLAAAGGRVAMHWYDFLCPFCYIAQDRNAELRRLGWEVREMGFQAHPEIPPEGIAVGPRTGPMYTHLQREAEAAGLPLRWPGRLPDTRVALGVAEWTRRMEPGHFDALQRSLFAAHFALEEDLGDLAVIERHAEKAGVDLESMRAAVASGMAKQFLGEAEAQGRRYGVRGTPAWWMRGELISGLLPRADFQRLADGREG